MRIYVTQWNGCGNISLGMGWFYRNFKKWIPYLTIPQFYLVQLLNMFQSTSRYLLVPIHTPLKSKVGCFWFVCKSKPKQKESDYNKGLVVVLFWRGPNQKPRNVHVEILKEGNEWYGMKKELYPLGMLIKRGVFGSSTT